MKAWHGGFAVAAVLCVGTLHAQAPMVDGVHLRPATAAVKVGGTLRLSLVNCDVRHERLGPVPPARGGAASGDRKSKVDELMPLSVARLYCEGDEGYGEALAPLVAPKDVRWQVIDGPGRVVGDLKGATYQAPAGRPKPNRATVAATITYGVGPGKTILHARITVLDEVKAYEGHFSQQAVQVREDFRTSLTGTIRWTLEDVDEDRKERDYVGKGKAAFANARQGCGDPSAFTEVPVEGQLKVHGDGRYEFRLALVSDQMHKRTCHRPDLDRKLTWVEEVSAGGEGLHSGDPCGRRDLVQRSVDGFNLTMARRGGCDATLNRFQEGWSFIAVE
jgi:hypothetical protein